ncbi:MAG: hypothetical protein GY703_21975 [Gammaproteobacteria bacterium]|nr:hypothetical protein [Gammaproteobacteria bacterium]
MGLKLLSGVVLSGVVLFFLASGTESVTDGLMILGAALVITAAHFWILHPFGTIESEIAAETSDQDISSQNTNGIFNQTSKLAIGIAEVSGSLDKLVKSIGQEQGHVSQISESCEQLSSLTDQVHQQVQESTEYTQRAHETSGQGHQSIEESAVVMSTLRDEVNQASEQLKSLQKFAALCC